LNFLEWYLLSTLFCFVKCFWNYFVFLYVFFIRYGEAKTKLEAFFCQFFFKIFFIGRKCAMIVQTCSKLFPFVHARIILMEVWDPCPQSPFGNAHSDYSRRADWTRLLTNNPSLLQKLNGAEPENLVDKFWKFWKLKKNYEKVIFLLQFGTYKNLTKNRQNVSNNPGLMSYTYPNI